MRAAIQTSRAGLACLSLLLLCLQARGQTENVVEVSTPEQLQAALAAGEKHIRVIEHLDGTGISPQFEWTNGATALFLVSMQTATITGACLEQPDLDLTADWREGMCLINVPDSVGFYLRGAAETLWMDNLYVYMTGEVPEGTSRFGYYVDLADSGASVYWTRMSIEAFPDHVDGTDTMTPQAAWGAGGRFEWLMHECSVVTNDANINASSPESLGSLSYFAGDPTMPLNATINLVNSNWQNIASEKPWFVYFATDLRVEGCTFTTDVPMERELVFDGRTETETTRAVYFEDSGLRVHSYVSDGEGYYVQQLPLSASTADERQAQGLAPFLTLDDPALLVLQEEVQGLAPAPAPAVLPDGPVPAEAPAPMNGVAPTVEGTGTDLQPESGSAVTISSGLALVLILAATLAAAS